MVVGLLKAEGGGGLVIVFRGDVGIDDKKVEWKGEERGKWCFCIALDLDA